MRNTMCTIWVTSIALIALLLSGVTASAALTTPLTSDSTPMEIAPDSSSHPMSCDSANQAETMQKADCNHRDTDTPAHQCCPSGSASGYALTTETLSSYLQPSQFIALPRDSSLPANSVASTLYRPPII